MAKKSRTLKELLASLQNVGSVSLEPPTKNQLKQGYWGKTALKAHGEEEVSFYFRIDRETSISGALRSLGRELPDLFLDSYVEKQKLQNWLDCGRNAPLEFARNMNGRKVPDTMVLLRQAMRKIRPGLLHAA